MAKSKHTKVWCVVSGRGYPISCSAQRLCADAIEAFLSEEEDTPRGNWNYWKKLGYTVQKFYLVPAEESDD